MFFTFPDTFGNIAAYAAAKQKNLHNRAGDQRAGNTRLDCSLLNNALSTRFSYVDNFAKNDNLFIIA